MASELSSMRFFVMKRLLEGSHDTGFSKVNPNRSPALHCPQCGEPLGMLTWQPPYAVEIERHGEDFGDLLEGPGGDILVTERFADAFQAEGLRGLVGFQPVEIVRVRGKWLGAEPRSLPRYRFVTVTSDGPAIDMERSRLRICKPVVCSQCRYAGIDAVEGLVLEAGTWKGEDVFRPRGLWGRILVSERFMHLAEKHAMSHMAWVPIEKYAWNPLGLAAPAPPGRAG
jgi:hypothetical protein